MTYPFLNLLLICRLLLIRQQRGNPQVHSIPDQQNSKRDHRHRSGKQKPEKGWTRQPKFVGMIEDFGRLLMQ